MDMSVMCKELAQLVDVLTRRLSGDYLETIWRLSGHYLERLSKSPEIKNESRKDPLVANE